MNILRLSTLSLILAILNVASAAKPSCPGDHPSCKEADETSGYSVDIIGDDVAGRSTENWLGGPKGVGLNDAGVHDGVGEFAHLSFLTADNGPFNGAGADCFPILLEGFLIHQGQVKRGKGGRAEAAFWFNGRTNDANHTVNYSLWLYGMFLPDPIVDFPPVSGTQEMIMTDWKTGVANEGKEIKSISCIGEGENEIYVTISVTKETE